MQTLTRLTILGREVPVKRTTAKELEAVSRDKHCQGYYDGETIYISRALNEKQYKRVLLHETAHVVLAISGITNMLDDDEEEAVCDAFESFLELFQNKTIAKFLAD